MSGNPIKVIRIQRRFRFKMSFNISDGTERKRFRIQSVRCNYGQTKIIIKTSLLQCTVQRSFGGPL